LISRFVMPLILFAVFAVFAVYVVPFVLGAVLTVLWWAFWVVAVIIAYAWMFWPITLFLVALGALQLWDERRRWKESFNLPGRREPPSLI
jgi:predicted membrane protein